MILEVLLAIGAIFSVSSALSYVGALKKYNYHPGPRPLFSPFSILGALIPTTWWNPGLSWLWHQRRTAYFNHTYDVIAMVPKLTGVGLYYTASLDVMKQLLVAEVRMHIIKPPDFTASLLLWGDNIVSANNEMWKRHRRHVVPAFTAKTYSLVWAETIAAYNEMIPALGWDQGTEFQKS
ncbi:hypothetical protein Hypma_006437 [Hypsizygus marmoreus]|uniref:Uncharacterized protein n=1 Tax=Hypsizygus marmoreus TaxID=39966 RepID=A0A369JTZ1_HYPMA|nr:hypothetical protein Hypma_006437 [Hypsizygus marmoreus]